MTTRSPIEQMVDRACGISPAEIERMKKEAAELADAQTAALLALEKSARAWWRQRRPVDWTRRKHLANPTVNCNGKDEIRLAEMVANWIKLGG